MLFDSIQVDSFNFDEINNGKFINVVGMDVQFPKMKCIYGVTTFNDKCYMELDLHNSERIDLFRTWMDAFDERVANHVHQNSLEIFGEAKSRRDVDDMFKKSTVGDTMKLKIDENTMAKNHQGHIVSVTHKGAMARSSCVVVAKPKLIYFINNIFGVSWYGSQVSFAPSKETAQKYMFID